MENAIVKARINPDIKAKAAEYLAQMGLTISDLIRMAITKTANSGRLPFEEIPNEETQKALEESEKGIGIYTAKDFDDLIRHLESDDE